MASETFKNNGVARWLSSRHVGASSSALAASILGYIPDNREPAFPHDSGDFGRCFFLWQMCGDEAGREGLERLARISGPWNRLSEQWGTLLNLYADEKHEACHELIRKCVAHNGSGVFIVKRGEDGRWDRFREQAA